MAKVYSPEDVLKKRVETIPYYVIDAFNDLYRDVTITYYRISTAVIGYARFVRNCQNEAKLLTKSGEILVDFGKSNLLNESFFLATIYYLTPKINFFWDFYVFCLDFFIPICIIFM